MFDIAALNVRRSIDRNTKKLVKNGPRITRRDFVQEFRQPESTHEGDCPICLLPVPLDLSESMIMSCCCKYICNGCDYADQMRMKAEMTKNKRPLCPFCRQPAPSSKEEVETNLLKRIEVNDPLAICEMGTRRYHEGDYDSAFEYYSKAVELGDAGAHYNLSCFYRDGVGVEKDKKKELHHLEEAAIGGYTNARNNLGCVEENNGRRVRAIKHWSIAAKLGNDGALQSLKDAYGKGYISKEDFASALRGHQAAVDATKSPQREEAEAALQKLEATGAV